MHRRNFGRPLRRILGRLGAIAPALQRANQWMSIGDYPAAAASFEDLAEKAEKHGGPRAPFLFLQAGRARILAGQVPAGLADIKRGLSLLAQAQRYNLLYRAGTRIVQELKAQALEKEALEISALIGAQPAAGIEAPADRSVQAKPILPTHCPACGGPLRSDESDWIDEITAECPFCGSPVRAEQ
jgi:hypothetical protein